MQRTEYQTVTAAGLNRESFPMKLWEKAKKYGIWNPADIDYSQDKKDWEGLSDIEQDFLLRTFAQFQAGEEAVTLDLLPLIMQIAKEGRIEEEMFLTTFLWEEAKHVDAFNRFLTEVVGTTDVGHLMVDSYKKIFFEILPEAMHILTTDPSPINMAKASTTYNMIVEGVLAETGYYGINRVIKDNNLMPGMVAFTEKLKQDESRHIAYGIYLLGRLVAEHGDPVYNAIQEQMNMLMVPAMGVIEEGYAMYGDDIPFGVDPNEYTAYAMGQFQSRWAKIEQSRTKNLEEVFAE